MSNMLFSLTDHLHGSEEQRAFITWYSWWWGWPFGYKMPSLHHLAALNNCCHDKCVNSWVFLLFLVYPWTQKDFCSSFHWISSSPPTASVNTNVWTNIWKTFLRCSVSSSFTTWFDLTGCQLCFVTFFRVTWPFACKCGVCCITMYFHLRPPQKYASAYT